MLRITLLLLFACVGAAAADQLIVSDVGTYITTALLGSTPVRLVLDSDVEGIWVRCSLFESRSCETADPSTIEGNQTKIIRRQARTHLSDPDPQRVTYTTKIFASIEVGGATFTDMNVHIAYNPLDYLPVRADGIFGMHYYFLDWDPYSSFAERVPPAVRARISMNLEDQTLVLNQSTASFATASARNTAVDLTPTAAWTTTVACVRPMMNATSQAPCLPLQGQSDETRQYEREYTVDPASSSIVIPRTSLEDFEEQYLKGCVPKIANTYYTLYYECLGSSSELVSRLPALAFEINSWRFTLQPIDYIDTLSSPTSVTRVLLSDKDLGIPNNILGAPFVRKFPVHNAANGPGQNILLVLCNEGDSCSAISANATNLKPMYEKIAAEETRDSNVTTAPPGTTEPNSAQCGSGVVWWAAKLLVTVGFLYS